MKKIFFQLNYLFEIKATNKKTGKELIFEKVVKIKRVVIIVLNLVFLSQEQNKKNSSQLKIVFFSSFIKLFAVFFQNSTKNSSSTCKLDTAKRI